MDIAVILSIVAICLTAFGLLFEHFAVLSSIKERLTALETKVSLFWEIIEKRIADIIRMPVHQELDNLLDRLNNQSLSQEELMRLDLLLNEEFNNSGDKGKKVAIALLQGRIQMLLLGKK